MLPVADSPYIAILDCNGSNMTPAIWEKIQEALSEKGRVIVRGIFGLEDFLIQKQP